MLAGNLEIQLSTGIARLEKDMRDAKNVIGNAVSSINTALGTIGLGLSAGLLIAKFDSIVDAMDKLRQSSEKTGASIEELSKLQFFAGVSGSSIEGVTGALVKLSKGMAESGNETSKTAQALKFLGLSAKDSAGNLKDPAVLYGEIAKELFKYQDGAGKAAIAIALMGKSGAEQLPTMKKMAELGDIEASTTAAQAKAAEEYRLELAKLHHQTEIFWNFLVGSWLPTMTELIKSFRETKEAAGWWGVFLKFADLKDGEDSIESLQKKLAGVQEVADSMRAKSGWLEKFLHADDINLLNLQIAAMTEKLKMLRDVESKAIAGLGGLATEPPGALKPLNFSLGDATKAAAELKLYQNALQALEQELGKLNEQTQVQKTTYQLLEGSLVKLTEADKKQGTEYAKKLIQKAAEIDLNKQLAAANKAWLEFAKASEAEQERQNATLINFNQAQSENIKNIEFETQMIKAEAPLAAGGLLLKSDEIKLISKLNLERETATGLRQIELNLERALLAIGPETNAGYEATAKSLRDLAEAQKEALPDVLAARETARLSNQLAKESSDEAKNLQVGMWQSVESAGHQAFLSIFDTGKSVLERLRDMIKTHLIEILYQMTIKKWIVQIVATTSGAGVAQSALGSTGGGLGGIGNIFSGGSSGAGMIGSLVGGFDSIFQNAGVSMGSQWIADIGNYGFGLPFISGLVMAATGNVAGGIGSTLGGIAGSYFGPIGTIVGSAIGGYIGSMFGGGQETVQGGAGANIDRSGRITTGVDWANVSGGWNPDPALAATQAIVKQFGDIVAALGGRISAEFGVGIGQGGGGEFNVGTSINGVQLSDRASLDQAGVQLESLRSLMVGLQQATAEFPAYVKRVFDAIDAGMASADQINAAIAFAGALKTLHEQLSETRTPAEIMVAQIQKLATALNANASGIDNWKVQFLAAIDAGIGPEALAQWQALGVAIAAVDAIAAQTVQQAQEALDSARGTLLDAYGREKASVEALVAAHEQLIETTRAAVLSAYSAEQQRVAGLQGAHDQAVSDAQRAVAQAQDAVDAAQRAAGDAVVRTVEQARDALNAARGTLLDAYGREKQRVAELVSAHEQLIQTTRAAVLSAYSAEQQRVAELQQAHERAVADAQREVDAARNQLVQGYEKETSALRQAQQQMEGFAKSLREFGESLKQSGSLSALSPLEKYTQAQQYLETTRGLAAGGDVEARGQVQGALTAFLEASRAHNASGPAFTSDYAYAQSIIAQLADMADQQAASSGSQADVIEAQIAALRGVEGVALSLDAALAKLAAAMGDTTAADATAALQVQTDQLTALGLLNTSTTSMSAALAAYNAALADTTSANAATALAAQTEQLTALGVLDSSVMSVSAALAAYQAAQDVYNALVVANDDTAISLEQALLDLANAQLQLDAVTADTTAADAAAGLQIWTDQLTQLGLLNVSTMSIADALAAYQAALADTTAATAVAGLEIWTSQLTALGVLNTSVLSIASALTGYQTALGTQNALPRARVEDMYLTLAGRTPDQIDPQGMSYWLGRLAVASIEQVMEEFRASVAIVNATPHAAGGWADAGYSLIGEQGPELVRFGRPALVYSAPQTRAMMSGAANDDLVTELQALRGEVARLTAVVQAGDIANVRATAASGEQSARAVQDAAWRQEVRPRAA